MKFERLLKIENLEKYFKYEDKPVLNNLNFELLNGEFLGLMGKSGSGKTTILNIIASATSYNKGRVYFDNDDIAMFSKARLRKYRANDVSMIYQDFKLVDFLTSFENIILPLNINKEKYDKFLIIDMAKELEIDNILNQSINNLSKGQMQRVAIIRGIIKKSRLILADEPTSALDSSSKERVLLLFKAINSLYNRSIIMASHDLKAISYCDRVIFLRDGKIFNELRRKEDEDRQSFLIRIENADRQLIR